MAGDPAGGGSAAGKSPRSSSRHRQFRDRAKTRVDDLQEIFSGLQFARRESRSGNAAVLEEQVHQMLREWRAELSVASPASSLQNSQGNSQGVADPSSETLRLLQLAIEEEDDATSRLAPGGVPGTGPSRHGCSDESSLEPRLVVGPRRWTRRCSTFSWMIGLDKSNYGYTIMVAASELIEIAGKLARVVVTRDKQEEVERQIGLALFLKSGFFTLRSSARALC